MAAPPDKGEPMTQEERKQEIRKARAGFERIRSQVISVKAVGVEEVKEPPPQEAEQK